MPTKFGDHAPIVGQFRAKSPKGQEKERPDTGHHVINPSAAGWLDLDSAVADAVLAEIMENAGRVIAHAWSPS